MQPLPVLSGLMSGIPVGTDQVGRTRIRAEQIYAITRATPLMMVMSVCAACILLASMLQDKREYWAIGWAFGVCAYSAYCYVLTLEPRKRGRAIQVSHRAILSAMRRSFVLGALWAALPALFFMFGETDSELTIFCLSCAMMGSGSFFLAPIPGAAYAFFVPVLIASIFAVFQIDTSDAMSFIALFVVFGVALARMSYLHAADLVARLQSQIEAERESGKDPTTGLPNRDHFVREMSVAFQRLNRFGEKFAVANLRFESFGADASPEAETANLVAFATRLQDIVEQTDVVGRIAEHEFAVILSGVGCAQQAAATVERLVKSLALPVDPGANAQGMRWAAGLALAPKDGASVADLTRAASRALFSARNSASRPISFFDADDEATVDERRQLEADLRDAVEQRQFHLEFQPILDVDTGRISSCEALVRWVHPKLGLLPPDVFIPIAERTGLIHEIGEWIMEDACRVLARLPSDVRMAMNISAAQLRGESVLSTLAHALAGSGVDNSRVDIEVTESLLISRDDPALAVIGKLADAGFAITLDDFGTGYASLNYLGRLPLKRVKIDREFTGAMLHEPRHAAIVNAILQLSSALGLEVTAEGVETAEQLELLRAVGCDSVQGYLISKPVPENELYAFFDARDAQMAA